ncbi:MAG: hypothetical protein WD469_00155 [Paenibacillaceae bacterium]
MSLINKNHHIQEFEDYLNKIIESLSINREESKELKEEWLQHLIDSKDHYMQKGIMIAMVIVSREWFSSSSEMNVIILNIFLLYGLLQQIIAPARILKAMNRLLHAL